MNLCFALLFSFAVAMISGSNLRTDPHVALWADEARRHASGRGHGVFVAGLEGTSHHFWKEVFESCVDMGDCRVPGPALERALYVDPPSSDSLALGWSLEALSVFSGTLVANTYTLGRGQQMLSYPFGRSWDATTCNHVPGHDSWCFPAVDILSQSARASGDELKVIVILRDADSILSSVQSRFNHSEALMVSAAIELERQLRLVPSESLLCVEPADLPAIGAEVAAMFGTRSPVFDYQRAMGDLWSPQGPNACERGSCRSVLLAERLQSLRRLCGKPPLPADPVAPGLGTSLVERSVVQRRQAARDLVTQLFGKPA